MNTMLTVLIYPTGRTVDAVIIAASDDKMRLVERNGRDALSLRKNASGRWATEDEQEIEIGALLFSNAHAKQAGPNAKLKAFTAGS